MPTRRDFLQNSSTLLLGGFLARPAVAGILTSATGRPIGLQLYTLRDQLSKDVKTTIAKVAEIGFNSVETFYHYESGKPASYWGLTPIEFRSLLKAHGLTSPSGHYQLSNFLTPSKVSDEELKAQLEIAATLGQSYFTVPVPPAYLWDKKVASIDDFKFIAGQLNKAGALSKKSNIGVMYHNHFWEFRKLNDGKSTGYEVLLKETDPSLVNFELDLFWAVKSGIDPVQLFAQHPGRFKLLHVKDIDKGSTEVITGPSMDTLPSRNVLSKVKFTEVGKGSIDFKKIMAHRQQAGVKHIFIEQDMIYLPDPFESVRQSYAYVKQNLV